jgi:hypothetical protein
MPAFAIVTMRDAEADYISVMLPEDWIFRRMVTQLTSGEDFLLPSGAECPLHGICSASRHADTNIASPSDFFVSSTSQYLLLSNKKQGFKYCIHFELSPALP